MRFARALLALGATVLVGACGGDDDDATSTDIGPVTTENDACTKLVDALKARADSTECKSQVLTLPVFQCPSTVRSISKAECAQYQVKSLDACVAAIPTTACSALADPCELVFADNAKGCN